MTYTDLSRRFTYHAPDTDKITVHETLRKAAFDFALLIDRLCPESREKSLAVTKTEEAVMWANAAVARHDIPADPPRSGSQVDTPRPVG